jgi:formylglycine-generating enzyme required for sulfatase activity
LRVDVLPAGSDTPCAACSNEFGVDADAFATGHVSFGVVPPPGRSGYRVRARMFRQAFAQDGEPDPANTIDVIAALPPVPVEGIVDATVVLLTDRVGTPADPSMPDAVIIGQPGKTRMGSWPSGQRANCADKTPDGQACVRGGAFWAGAVNSDLEDEPSWHRLVVISPFFVDKTEVTVGAARANNFSPYLKWSGSSDGTQLEDWCTWTPLPVPRGPDGTSNGGELLPLNCVGWDEARTYCQARGGDLPSEMQFEYLLGGLANQPYIWGRDIPKCADPPMSKRFEAIWGRNGLGLLYSIGPQACRTDANFLAPMGGPEPPGKRLLDTLSLPDGDVTDLAGNDAEWALDGWQARDDDCWLASGIFADPVCPPNPKLWQWRGAGWINGVSFMTASSRHYAPTASISVGFRCVRND